MSQQINLFNPIFLKQKKYFSALAMLQALGMILAGCIVLAAWLGWQSAQLKAEAARTAGRLVAAQAQLKQLAELGRQRQPDPRLEGRVRELESRIASMKSVFVTLDRGDLGNTSGYSDYFRAFARQTVSGVWLTGLTVGGGGSDLSIEGRALQADLVPGYLARLKQEKTLQGKSFASLEMQEAARDKNTAPSDGRLQGGQPAYIEFRLRGSEARVEQGGEQGK